MERQFSSRATDRSEQVIAGRWRRLTRVVVAIAFSLALAAASTGCGPVDETTRTIDGAIRELDRNSAAWRDILEHTRETLIKQGQSTLAVEVEQLLSSGVSDVAIESRCTTDFFFKDRARNLLDSILFWHKNKKKPTAQPVFCNPTPAKILLDLEPERRAFIEISGYNLSRDAVRVAVERKSNGERVDVSKYLDDPSSYLLTLNVSALWNDQKALLEEDGTRFEFTLGTEPDARKQTVAIVPRTIKPQPTYIATRLRIAGTMDLRDDENWPASDETRKVDIDHRVIVRPGVTTTYYKTWCVGGEVSGYITIEFDIDNQTGRISGRGLSEYFETDDCSRNDRQASEDFTFTLYPKAENAAHSYTVNTNLNDAQGGVATRLLVDVIDECLSDSPPEACRWLKLSR
jgi:hypothetical protein